MPNVLILTGPTAAGKTSIAKTLAADSPRCALVEYDRIHEMFANPHIPPWLPGGREQQMLWVRMVCDLTREFVSEGHDAIVADVLTDDTAALYREELARYSPIIIQLLPDFDTLRARFHRRGPVLTDAEFADVYREQMGFSGYDVRIDNSSLAPEEVATKILAL